MEKFNIIKIYQSKKHNFSRHPYAIGEYLHHRECRFCKSKKLVKALDFGYVPLAGGFLKKDSTAIDFANEHRYPLPIMFCSDCYLLQVADIVGGETLFKDYFYFSSAIGTLVDHFREYAKDLASLYSVTKKVLTIEIGCNDGVFLKPLQAQGFKVLGIDPATNVVAPLIKKGMPIINDFFTESTALAIAKKHGKAEIILSSNSFAHIDNMHDVMRGVDVLLSKTGFLAFEVHYLGTLIKEIQYDMMYHEHQSYYSLLTLQKFFSMFDMEVFDVKAIPIHAGSMRYYVQRKKTGGRNISKAARSLAKEEKLMGLDSVDSFHNFQKYITKTKTDLLALLKKLKKQGKTIVGYGASGRATAVSTFCELTNEHLDYVIDDAPAKQGSFTPGNHLKIVNSSILDDPKKRPDYCLLFAWSFINEIKEKQQSYFASGGKFIIPLPAVKIIRE